MSAQHTPGPWAWFGDNHDIYLATTHSGRRYVMGFERMGMRSAQPTFQVAQRMRPAAELVEFQVGDGRARGFAEGKADPSVYRLDVKGIDCPDARLIAAAPDLYEAGEPFASIPLGPEVVEDAELVLYRNGPALITVGDVLRLRAALAQARGEA